jgi:hypothetical protein
MSITVLELMENFKLSRKEANDLFRWIGHPSMSPDAVLMMANSLLHGYGVVSCRDERAWVDSYYGDTIALYVNTGETYDTTLLYDTEAKEFLVISWGDWYEAWDGEQEMDSELNDRAVVPKLREIDTILEEAFRSADYDLNESGINGVGLGDHEFEMSFEKDGYEVTVSVTITSPKE